jgi:hypothetical protein
VLWFLKPTSTKAALLGLAGLAVSGFTAQAQSPSLPASPSSVQTAAPCPAPGCPTPYPSMPGVPTFPLPPTTQPKTPETQPRTPTPGTGESTTPTQPTSEPAQPSLPGEQASAQESSDIGLSAPNMIGDLLYSSRSVQFGLGRINGNSNFFGLGSTSIVNASVAENNSPIPQDRVYFRYNFFSNSQSVTGINSQPVEAIPGSNVFLFSPQTKKYDTNMYTLGGEKTFLDKAMSVEVRLPIVTTLSTSNTLSVGNNTGPVGGADGNGNPLFGVLATPGNTLGNEGSYFGNMSVILKGLVYHNDCNKLSVSAGLGIGIPTAPDTHLSVVDYTGGSGAPQTASGQQLRQFTIANETWALSPFLAALYTPTDRFFTQGFLQVEAPLNSSPVTYSDQYLLGQFGTAGSPPLQNALATGQSLRPPFTIRRSIDEQTLAHLDLGAGYWLVRSPENRWLNGLALSFEAHYTGALTNADRIQLPGNGTLLQLNPSNPIAGIQSVANQIPNIGPVVGAGPTRVDIVDLTAGTTFVLGSQTSLATAFTVPVSNGTNKTFDWEFQLQLNFYFGNR